MDDEDSSDVGVQGYLKISVTILGWSPFQKLLFPFFTLVSFVSRPGRQDENA